MSTKGRFTLWQSLIICAGLFLSGISSWMLYQGEVRDVNNALKIDLEQRGQAFTRMLFASVEPLHAISVLFESETVPTYAQFNKQAQRILTHHDTNILAIEWIPKVVASQRKSVEQAMVQYYPNYQFTQKGLNRTMVPAIAKDVYYPVYYVFPSEGNEPAMGFDLSSDAKRYATLIDAKNGGVEMASAGINLVQKTRTTKGFLVFLPVYKEPFEEIQHDKALLDENLLGFVLGVYDIGELFKNSALSAHPLGLELLIYDNLGANNSELLFRHMSRTSNSINRNITYQKALPQFYSRQWTMVAMPTHEYVARFHSVIPYLVATFGSLLTLLTVFYLRILQNQTTEVQRLVDEKTRELNIVNEKLKHISRTDSLTNIANRRCMDSFFEQEWGRAIRYQSPLSLIMIDIDHFKQYNDFYGHQLGDECLIKVATALAKIVGRPGDMVARYGGEEFCLIIAHSDDVSSIANKCRSNIEALKIPHQISPVSEYVTISVGYCTYTPMMGQLGLDMFKSADRALYQAKEKGRNCLVKAMFECSKKAAIALSNNNDLS